MNPVSVSKALKFEFATPHRRISQARQPLQPPLDRLRVRRRGALSTRPKFMASRKALEMGAKVWSLIMMCVTVAAQEACSSGRTLEAAEGCTSSAHPGDAADLAQSRDGSKVCAAPNDREVAPSGSWSSPITSDLIVASSIGLGSVFLSEHGDFWLEGRPKEGGRTVLVHRDEDGTEKDVTPSGFNVRTKVHEYGGGALLLDGNSIFFSNFDDQRIYSQHTSGTIPKPVTSDDVDMRYADYIFDHKRQSLIAVREDHTKGKKEPENTIVRIETGGDQGVGTVLVSGYDFYSNPRLSPDGSKLAWVCWNHPNMPWDDSELWVADVNADGSLSSKERVAGGKDESVCEPQWSPDGVLYFISDQTNWWNLYRFHGSTAENVLPMDADFGEPHWIFGSNTYVFESPDQILCTYAGDSGTVLMRLCLKTLKTTEISTPFSSIKGMKERSGEIGFLGGSTTAPVVAARMNLASGHVVTLKVSSKVDVATSFFSIPESIEFSTEGGKNAYGYYYPPTNPDFRAPDGEKPPVIVEIHGGPTSAAKSTFSLGIQFWTSRGFGVFDVNYGGSTGYGREYRNRLKGNWGIVDVDDCCNGAQALAKSGRVDGNRMIITGGSAGGFTTLAALAFRNVFNAGASHFGVSDLEGLTKDTHKFESRYLDGLIGPYPERKDLYVERSPINHVESISSPLLLLQGDEDKVVPPNQAELMFEALKSKGLPVAYVLFEGEQHGFRKAENMKRAIDVELYFYSRVFNFTPADTIDPVPIENL